MFLIINDGNGKLSISAAGIGLIVRVEYSDTYASPDPFEVDFDPMELSKAILFFKTLQYPNVGMILLDNDGNFLGRIAQKEPDNYYVHWDLEDHW